MFSSSASRLGKGGLPVRALFWASSQGRDSAEHTGSHFPSRSFSRCPGPWNFGVSGPVQATQVHLQDEACLSQVQGMRPELMCAD